MSELLFTQSLIKQENSISVLCGSWFRDDFVTRLRPAPGSSRSRRSVGGDRHLFSSWLNFFVFFWKLLNCREIKVRSSVQESGRCVIKCKSLDSLKHGILLVAVHLDTVDGRHGNVGRLGCPQRFFAAAEESLDLQRDATEGSYSTTNVYLVSHLLLPKKASRVNV